MEKARAGQLSCFFGWPRGVFPSHRVGFKKRRGREVLFLLLFLFFLYFVAFWVISFSFCSKVQECGAVDEGEAPGSLYVFLPAIAQIFFFSSWECVGLD